MTPTELPAELLAAITPNPDLVRPTGTEKDWPANLSPEHRDYQSTRGVGSLVAAARGLHTVDAGSLEEPPSDGDVAQAHWGRTRTGANRIKVRLPLNTNSGLPADLHTRSVIYNEGVLDHMKRTWCRGMVIPLYGTYRPVDENGDPRNDKGGWNHWLDQLRLDVPRTRYDFDADKETCPKFEIPAGAKRGEGWGNIPPDVNPLANPDARAKLLTEGQAKGDSVLTSARREGLDLCPITAIGVTALMEKVAPGSKEKKFTEAFTSQIDVEGNLVFMGWDADWRSNIGVGYSMLDMGDGLLARGAADVRIIEVPMIDGDTKSGIDDYLAWAETAGIENPLSQLLAAAIPLEEARVIVKTYKARFNVPAPQTKPLATVIALPTATLAVRGLVAYPEKVKKTPEQLAAVKELNSTRDNMDAVLTHLGFQPQPALGLFVDAWALPGKSGQIDPDLEDARIYADNPSRPVLSMRRSTLYGDEDVEPTTSHLIAWFCTHDEAAAWDLIAAHRGDLAGLLAALPAATNLPEPVADRTGEIAQMWRSDRAALAFRPWRIRWSSTPQTQAVTLASSTVLRLPLTSVDGFALQIQGTLSMLDALSSPVPLYCLFDEDDARHAVIVSQDQCWGTYTMTPKKVTEEDGTETTVWLWVRNYAWAAWRPRVVRHMIAAEDGTPTECKDPEFEVQVLRKQSVCTFTASATDSLAPAKIVEAANLGLSSPASAGEVKLMRDSLSMLGRSEQGETAIYSCTGWVLHEGRIVFLAPNGSLGADGLRGDMHVTGSSDKAEGASVLATTGMGQIGWPELPTSHAQLHRAWEDTITTLGRAVPRSQVVAAVLGVQLAAPLGMSSRGVVYLQAEPGSGKTLVMQSPSAFQRGQIGDHCIDVSIPLASGPGTRARMSWGRGIVTAGDDFRTEGVSPFKAAQAKEVVELITQMGFGAGQAAKATQTGNIRADAPGQGCAIIGGEVEIVDTAIVDRQICIKLRAGDVAFSSKLQNDGTTGTRASIGAGLGSIELRKGGAAWDRWAEVARSGAPRLVLAAYLSWLAARAERLGGIAALHAEASQIKAAWIQSRPAGRAKTTVGTVAVGWFYFGEFCEEVGIGAWMLEDGLTELIDSLMDDGVARRAKLSPGQRLLATIDRMLSGHAAHLLAPGAGIPTNAGKFGWVAESTYASRLVGVPDPGVASIPQTVWRSQGKAIGFVLDGDDPLIGITPQGLKEIWHNTIGGSVYDANEAGLRLAPYLVTGKGMHNPDKPGTVRPSWLLAGERIPRCYVIRASQLRIDPDDVDGYVDPEESDDDGSTDLKEFDAAA